MNFIISSNTFGLWFCFFLKKTNFFFFSEDYQEFNTARLAELEILYKSKLDTIRNEFTKRDEQQDTPPKPREIRVILDSTKKEHRILIEQHRFILLNLLEQLENDLHDIIEQNRQHYEISDREYKQLQIELPELDCIIVHLRENTVNLWSEINTYRYLLVNLLSSNNEKSQQIPSHPIPPPPADRPKPIEKYTTTSTTTTENNHIQTSTNSKPLVKPTVNKITTISTKAKPYIEQYRDETTGFIVHIENGIIWVRIWTLYV
jgi:hypothetical protein